MERIIKFRAWDKMEGKMWQKAGIDAHDNFCYAEPNPKGGSTMKQFDDLHIEKYGIYHFDSIALMQFTGLKDKNGREIWEGDIILRPDDGYIKFKGEPVVFKNGCFKPLSWSYGRWNEVGEIIGNIYEHPHLLQDSNAKAGTPAQ